MPELPEAEITKQKLQILIGKKIKNFWTNLIQNLKISSYSYVKKDIKNRKIIKIKRWGKTILIYIFKKNNLKILAIHHRMSGRLIIKKEIYKNLKILKHVHFIITFNDKTKLLFEDQRKFGIVWYGSENQILNDKYFKNLGPDALNIDFNVFKNKIINRKGEIKHILLNQKIIAGIGNILADEILWYSQIHPKTKIQDLNLKQIKKLWQASQKIIKKSIKLGGTSMRNWFHPDENRGYFQNKTFVYNRKNKSCIRCKTKIIKIKSAGRGTFICPSCQKLN